MAAVTKNIQYTQLGNTGMVVEYPVEALNEIYIGTFVGWDTSEDALESCPSGAADEFIGIALERKTGGAADGDVTCKVLVGAVIEKTLASVAATNLGDLVYADNNNDLSTTSTSNTLVGRIVGIVAGVSDRCLVKCLTPFHPIVDTT